MSDAVETGLPSTCSGLAYSGVNVCIPCRVTLPGVVCMFWLTSFAVPKSSSFGVPSSCTTMFSGLRSR